MDPNIIAALDWGFKIAAIVGGWFLKVLFDKLKDLERNDGELARAVNDLRVALPTVYAQRADIEKLGDGMFAHLRRIEDKLDRKVDREGK